MAKIFLDIGHGNNTFPPGKGVYKGGVGYAEHDFNAKLGMAIKDLLEQNGHEVIMGQQPNAPEVGLTTRTNLYNREGADFGISVHANANGNANVNGRCAFYWHTSKEGKALAQDIIAEIKAQGYSTHGNGLHASKRGSWTNLHITRETNMPAVLIEFGFMTGNKDFNLIFGTKQDQYIKDMAEATVKGIQKHLGASFKGEAEVKSTPKKEAKPAPKKSGTKTISQMADEVLANKHGNGHENRRKSLGVDQATYEKVRAEVNRRAGAGSSKPKATKSISQMADEVLANKHGNGHENRRKSLGIDQATYEKVRAEVNRRASGGSVKAKPKPSKSISQMADEILANRHGNGHETRRKSLGIDKATYEKVRAEVNRRAGGRTTTSATVNLDSIAQQIVKGIDSRGRKVPNGHSARQKHFGLSNSDYQKVRNRVNELL